VLRVEEVVSGGVDFLAGCIHGIADGVEYRGHVGLGGGCRGGVEWQAGSWRRAVVVARRTIGE